MGGMGLWKLSCPNIKKEINMLICMRNRWKRFPNPSLALQPKRFPALYHSVTKSCQTLCDPMDSSKSGFPVLHHLLEFAQAHEHWVGDAIQPSHPLLSPSPPTFSLSQHQGLFQWVSSLHQVAKVLELQRQHQPFQWIFRVDFLQDWSPCSPRDSQDVSSSSAVRKHPFFGAQPSLCSNSHMHTWLLEKP